VPAERQTLRTTFDSAARTYQSARPDYPDELFADLVAVTGLAPSAHLLEVGCGSGKATVPLARRGFRITAVELGAHLADAARANLAPYPDVNVVHSNFERWNPPDGTSFDLVYAATAWGWIDPVVKYAKAAALLRPGGHLAAWAAEHGMPEGFDPFFTDIQAVYNEIGEGHPGPWPPPIPDEVPDDSAAFEESDWFDVVAVRRYVWAIDYDADGYLALGPHRDGPRQARPSVRRDPAAIDGPAERHRPSALGRGDDRRPPALTTHPSKR